MCVDIQNTNNHSIWPRMMNRSIENDIFFCLDRAPRVITSPWFIGLIVSIILLIIIVAIVCGIMRRKGGKYSGKYSLICFFIDIFIRTD